MQRDLWDKVEGCAKHAPHVSNCHDYVRHHRTGGVDAETDDGATCGRRRWRRTIPSPWSIEGHGNEGEDDVERSSCVPCSMTNQWEDTVSPGEVSEAKAVLHREDNNSSHYTYSLQPPAANIRKHMAHQNSLLLQLDGPEWLGWAATKGRAVAIRSATPKRVMIVIASVD
jgi:hypothetical protein